MDLSEVAEEETPAEDDKEEEGSGTAAEKTDSDDSGDSEETVTEEQDGDPGQKPTEPAEEEEPEIAGEPGVQPDAAAAPQNVEDGETEPEVIYSGTGWTLDANGKLTITSDEGMADWCTFHDKADVDTRRRVITAEIQDGVTRIGENAFSFCTCMTSVKMRGDVQEIGQKAFYGCRELKDITIPAGMKKIGEMAFTGCTGLTEITIPEGVTDMGNKVLSGCSNLTKITLPSDMKSITESMFESCGKLTDIEIPEGVTTIGESAFSGCSGLTEIEIPTNVTEVGSYAFKDCIGLTSMEIPAGVTEIGRCVFEDCTGLTDVRLPADAKKIVDGMFSGCEGLATIEIPADVEIIEESAFSGCSGLTEIKIPAGVTAIGGGAFFGCSSLTEIAIPAGVTSIEYSMFWECSGLEHITLPAGITDIGEAAFGFCSALTSIKIPDEVKSIGNMAFYGCSGLAGITIPSGVTDIGCGAFYECGSLANVTMQGTVPPTLGIMDEDTGKTEVFTSCKFAEENTQGITVPVGTLDAYQNAWTEWADYIAEESVSDKEKVEVVKSAVEAALAQIQVSNATTKESFETALKDGIKGVLEEAGIGSDEVAVVVENFSRAAATTAAPGSVSASIKISSGAESDSVPVHKTIAKLPLTDADKVAAAKAAVEAALAEIQVSNATTEDSLGAAIQDAVKAALEEAGIPGEDVTVTVENFARTDATLDAPGSVSASIKIASGTESVSVPVDKVIGKLPATPADKVASAKAAVEAAVRKAVDAALAGTTVTNDNAEETAAKIAGLIPDTVAGALAEAGVSAEEVAAGEAGIKIEQAAADREGSITITIPLTSREDAGQADSAMIRVPVAKPDAEDDPGKDAAEAQKLVEDALKGITATNETKKEDILDTLQEELGDKAKVEGIEKFEKQDATEDMPGNISLSIHITINGKTVIVNVTVPIAQLTRRNGVYVRFTDYHDLDGSTPCYKYTGSAIKPAVRVYNNEELLTAGTDYTIGYKNNTKVGTAALTVKGKGKFSGTSDVVSFTIINADVEKDTEHPTEMTVVVNTKVAPVIMNGTKKLTTKDYQLEGDGLVNGKYAAATAEGTPNTLTVKGVGSYVGSSFEMKVRVIERSAARKLSVTVDSGFRPVYSGSVLDLGGLLRKTQDGEGAITVTDAKDKTKILREGTDFTVLCTSGLTSAGTVKFTVTGMGEYTGSVNRSFKIAPLKVADSSRFSVDFDRNKAYEYRAAGTTVDGLVVKYLGETDGTEDDRILRKGTDYKVTYSNHKKVSGTKEAELKIAFLGNYKGSSAVSETFRVVPAKLSAANTAVIVPDKVYTKGNRAYKSTPIVTVDGAAIKASQYTVSYAWATESEAGDDTKYVSDDRVKITMAEGDSWAKVRVTVTPKQAGSYALAEGAVLTGEYYVRRADGAADLSRAKVTFHDREGRQHKALEYNGNPFYTPAGNNPGAENAPDDPNAVYVKVTVGGAVVDPDLYDVIWTDATEKGKATVVIRGKGVDAGKGLAVGSRNQTISIKAMVLKGRTLESILGR